MSGVSVNNIVSGGDVSISVGSSSKTIKFLLFSSVWGGRLSGIEVCEKHGIDVQQTSNGVYVNLTAEQLFALANDSDCDMLISGKKAPKLIAFDDPGWRFRQR